MSLRENDPSGEPPTEQDMDDYYNEAGYFNLVTPESVIEEQTESETHEER
jgi:hypothetical protein